MKYLLENRGIMVVTLIILIALVVGFVVSSAFVFILCWAFGVTFHWSYVIGYILIMSTLYRK